ARARFDDRRAARLDEAVALGGVEHRDANAVLDRASRVERLQLSEELDVDVAGKQPRELHHRGVPDVVGDVDRDSGHRAHSAYRRPRLPLWLSALSWSATRSPDSSGGRCCSNFVPTRRT